MTQRSTLARTSVGTVGWLGAGLMAAPMIRRQLAAGWKVFVWNRTREKVEPLVAAGAVAADSPAQVAALAEDVMMCVMDAPAVEQTVFGEQGFARAGAQQKAVVLVDHSSIAPEQTRLFAARLLQQNRIDWIDAPVSGGVAGATQGSLAIMAGGPQAALQRVMPALGCYAGRITHMGPSGAGQTTKLINQILVCSAVTTIAESVALAQAAGIDAAKIPVALAGGFADSKPLQIFAPRMANGYQDSIGALSTLLKDIDTALELARSNNCALPMAASAQQLLRLMSARGLGDADIAELISLYRKS